MRESMNQVADLLRAKIQCIWISTYEESEVIKDLRSIISNMTGTEMFVWSHTEGLQKQALTKFENKEPADTKYAQPKNLFDLIGSRQSNTESGQDGVFVLRDFHLINDNHAVVRGLRDIKEYPSANYNPIIVISPTVSIPSEHEKLFTIIDYDVPSKSEVISLLKAMAAKIRKSAQQGKDFKAPTEEEQEQLVKACVGLTLKEITDVFAKSLVKYKELSLRAIMEEKIQLIRKSGVLDYSVPSYSFDDVGGNHAYKDWIQDIEYSFSEEAREFGVKLPKGCLHLGVPGTSKTMMAEALASKMNVPLIKLQMSRIMDRLVGQSEKKIDQALKTVKACAPCILLVDEIEKALGGISSSSQTDGGTLARVFGSILQFLNDNDSGVFVVMTSNDVSQLPPELTRSGRLDAMWYFTLPTVEERREIFSIHLGKTGKEITDELLNISVDVSEHFTGAEIAETVKVAVRKAFKRYRQDGVNAILEDDIREAASEIIPLFKSSKEKIMALDAWSQGRARSTNYVRSSEEFNAVVDDDLLSGVLELKR